MGRSIHYKICIEVLNRVHKSHKPPAYPIPTVVKETATKKDRNRDVELGQYERKRKRAFYTKTQIEPVRYNETNGGD